MIRIDSTSDEVALEFNNVSGWSVVVRGEELGLSLSDRRVLLSLLPFLEVGKKGIVDKVNSTDALEVFPEMTLIEAGLRNGSEHWVSCALDWLKDKEPEEISGFYSYLQAVYDDKQKYSQPLRHKAKALLKVVG